LKVNKEKISDKTKYFRVSLFYMGNCTICATDSILASIDNVGNLVILIYTVAIIIC
jgi:hypothetical protein